jgi:hypothetical protein
MIIKEVVLFAAILLSLSPIMKTLTEDTSNDTIYALSVCLFFANILFHDYGSTNTTNIKYASYSYAYPCIMQCCFTCNIQISRFPIIECSDICIGSDGFSITL